MKNNWCIKGCKELGDYIESLPQKQCVYGTWDNYYYFLESNDFWNGTSGNIYSKEIITFQQFLDMNKKIIGYIVKPQFKDAAAKVTGVTDYNTLTCNNNTSHFAVNSIAKERLKSAQVLDLWCEPVHESKPEFKIGDIVVVTERHRNNPSKAGDIVEIRKIDDHTIPYYVYNKREDDCDWCVNVRKPTEAEVEEYNSKSKVFTINCDEPFEVEVSKQGIFYKNEYVWICPIDIGELLSISDDYSVQYDKVKINGASKKWDISINTVNIGCNHNCNLVDITLAYNYYKSLQ